MKLVLRSLYFIISLILISCSGEDIQNSTDDDPKTQKPVNKAPSSPKLILPENNLACTYSTMTFEWEQSTDPEGENVHYEFELSEKENFEDLIETVETSNTSVSLDLEKGTSYYWRVLSLDEDGNESDHDEIRSFFTEPSLTYNSIPQNPNSENPLNNTTVDKDLSLLEWISTDQDGDSLTFDVYFGIANPPPLIKENIKENSIKINLNEVTTYYWQIIAKDAQGAKAVGPVWKFNVN